MEDNPPAINAPRFAFLGFCQRAESIRNGHIFLWHTNLLGLSNTRALYLFPANLREHKLAFAIYRPRVHESFKLLFRPTSGGKDVELTFHISGIEIMTPTGSSKLTQEAETGSAAGDPGWIFQVLNPDCDVWISEPGEYLIYLADEKTEQLVGSVLFAAVGLSPFTSEEIAALKSSPFATKLIRVELRCTICSDLFRAYTGLERNPKMQADGWIWNHDIEPAAFACKCGATNIPLKYVKHGLHALLRDRLNARPGEEVSPTVSLVRLYEQSALEEYCRQFRRLIDSNPGEEDVQKFLESHTVFLWLFLPRKLMFKKPVLSKYVVDFAILNERKELLLIEIERPGLRLQNKDGGVTAELQHALDQVRRWIREFDKFRDAALDCFGLKLEEVAKVRGTVIAGRSSTGESEPEHVRTVNFGDIEFYTYDDLLESVTKIVQHVAKV